MTRKDDLRAKALRARSAIPSMEIKWASRLVEANLRSLPEYATADLLVSYCAKRDEVQTSSIIGSALKEGKRVAVVVSVPETRTLTYSEITSLDELSPGHYGIPEPRPELVRPVQLEEADLILVPVVAWDTRGHRLGHGEGYFDRALADQSLPKVGLALESQRVDRIPHSRDDVPLDAIVTEKRVVRVGGERFVLNRKGK
jgi:5-formyltetrahydrofolate cyclo-ligase